MYFLTIKSGGCGYCIGVTTSESHKKASKRGYKSVEHMLHAVQCTRIIAIIALNSNQVVVPKYDYYDSPMRTTILLLTVILSFIQIAITVWKINH